MPYRLPTLALWIVVVALVGHVPAAAEDKGQPSGPGSGRSAEAGDLAVRSFHTATGLLNRGLHDLAAEEFQRFLSRYPDHSKANVARYGLAVCFFRTSQHDKAVGELEQLHKVSEFEYAAEVGTMLGRLRLALGDHEAAVEAFEAVIQRHRSHDLADDAVAGSIEALYHCARYDDAIARARMLRTRWPDSPLASHGLFYWALAAMGNQDYAGAAERFQELLSGKVDEGLAEQGRFLLGQCLERADKPAEAEAVYREVVQDEDGTYRTEALAALAGVLHRQGQPAEAGALLDTLLGLKPDSGLAGDAAIHRARIWFEQGDIDKALELLGTAAKTAQDRGDEVTYWTAKCELRRGNPSKAAKGFEAVIERYPDSALLPEASYDRSVALLQAGDVEEAGRALAEFRSRFPSHELAPEALRLLAVLARNAGDYARSQEHCREFVRAHPEHSRSAEIAFLSAENAYLSGELARAIEQFDSFIDRYGDDPRADTARFRTGMAAYRLERFDEAMSRLKPLVEQKDTPDEFRAALLAVGDIHFQRGQWAKAEPLLDTYLETGTGVALADHALLKLGLARQRQGKYSEALEAYDRLLDTFEKSPHRRQAMFERGQVLVQLGRPDDAAKAFQAATSEAGDSALEGHALYQLGSLAMQSGDYTAAVEQFRRAEGLLPDPATQAEACFQRGQALMAAEQYAQAQSAFDAFLQRFPNHERAAQARAQAAVALARQDRAADAVAAIAGLEKQGAHDLRPEELASLHYEKAWALRELGKTDEAAKAYQELLDNAAAGPELAAHARLELAQIRFESKDYEAAAELLRVLREKQADGSGAASAEVGEQAAYYLASSEFELGRLDEAGRLFEEFLDEFPNSELRAPASLCCGEALLQCGHHERAARHLRLVVDEFPSDPACEPAMLRLGDCLAALQRWSRSERVLTEHLNRFGQSEHWFQAQFGVGWARENQKRYDEAIAAYRKVTEGHHGPTAARAQFQIGECLYAQGQLDQAVSELLKVDILYAYPEWSAASLYEAGRCFEELHKTAEARQQFETVVRKYPDSKWSTLASQRLASLADGSLPGR